VQAHIAYTDNGAQGTTSNSQTKLRKQSPS